MKAAVRDMNQERKAVRFELKARYALWRRREDRNAGN